MSKCVTCNDREATTGTKQCKKCWRRDYRQRNKEHISKVARARYIKTKPEKMAYARMWNDKNRERKIAKQKAYLKAIGYASDKTPKRMAMRRLRALTNVKYPILPEQLCELCLFNKATQRHHTTIPYHIDRFVFICKGCHDVITALTKKYKADASLMEKTK